MVEFIVVIAEVWYELRGLCAEACCLTEGALIAAELALFHHTLRNRIAVDLVVKLCRHTDGGLNEVRSPLS